VAKIVPPEGAILLHGWVAVLLVLLSARAGAEPRPYRVDPTSSRVSIHVGRAGLFSFAGHEHEVRGPIAEGDAVLDLDDPARCSVQVMINAGDLRVTGEGEPAKDVPAVQENMAGPKVLDAARFPHITYRSRTVAASRAADGSWNVEIAGDLTLRDVTRAVPLRLRVVVEGPRLQATGALRLKQSEFGIQPISVAGVVKVKDELELKLDVTALSGPE
jgi:polyisoprenoid-binding protein YceI